MITIMFCICQKVKKEGKTEEYIYIFSEQQFKKQASAHSQT